MCVSYNVHKMNQRVGQGVGDRVLVAFDVARVTVECVAIPLLWMTSAWEHLPDLWSVDNTFLAISRGQNVGKLKDKVRIKKKVAK